DARGVVDRAAGDELPDYRADEGAEEDAWDAEEQSDDGADQCTPHRGLAGAVAFRSVGAGKEVEHDRERGKHAKEHDYPDRDFLEVPDPSGQQHAPEHHRYAWQVRKNGADEARCDDDAGDDVPEDGPVHRRRIAALLPLFRRKGGAKRTRAQRDKGDGRSSGSCIPLMHLLSAGASTPFLAEGGVRRATLVP